MRRSIWLEPTFPPISTERTIFISRKITLVNFDTLPENITLTMLGGGTTIQMKGRNILPWVNGWVTDG